MSYHALECGKLFHAAKKTAFTTVGVKIEFNGISRFLCPLIMLFSILKNLTSQRSMASLLPNLLWSDGSGG